MFLFAFSIKITCFLGQFSAALHTVKPARRRIRKPFVVFGSIALRLFSWNFFELLGIRVKITTHPFKPSCFSPLIFECMKWKSVGGPCIGYLYWRRQLISHRSSIKSISKLKSACCCWHACKVCNLSTAKTIPYLLQATSLYLLNSSLSYYKETSFNFIGKNLSSHSKV